MSPLNRPFIAASALGLMLTLGGCGDDIKSAACDTGISELSSFDQCVETNKQTAKLSGVVEITNTSGAFAKPGLRKPHFAASVAGQSIEGTPAPKTLILAVDAWGNTVTDQADSVGGFNMELDAGKLYAFIFIDTRTMEVLGSLVQAANTANAAAVALADDTNLGAVVIDPVSGRAVSEADATPESVTQTSGTTVKVVDASELDSDGDGMVTQDDITALQAKALESGSTKIKKLSPLNFMGDRNTWVAENQVRTDEWNWTDPNTGDVMSFAGETTEGRFRIVREKQVEGPNGGQITVLKHADVNYMRKEVGTETYTPAGGTATTQNRNWGGYYNGLIAQINADWSDSQGYTQTSLTASGDWANLSSDCQQQISDRDSSGGGYGVWCGDPFSGTAIQAIDPAMPFTWETGLWAWSRYQYADQESGMIIEGEWDHENRKVKWEDQGGIPLELELGTAITQTHTESWIQPNASGADETHEMTMSFSFIPKLVDGMLTDTLGNKLPIIRIDMGDATTTYTVNGVAQAIPDGMAPDMQKEAFYILAKYGAEASAFDKDGNPVAWQDAFKNFRFGIITKPVLAANATTVQAERCGTSTDSAVVSVNAEKSLVICKTSPESIAKADGTTADMSGAMPGADASTSAIRNTWLAWLSNNINQLEVVDYNNFENSADTGGAGGGAYFWVEHNEDTWSAVEPLNYDPVNYLMYPLTAGATQTFVSTRTPDTTVGGETTADNNVSYMGKTVHFVYQLRVWDPNATNPYDSTMKGAEVVLASSDPISASDATVETKISVQGSIAIPALTKTSTAYPESWTYWEHDSVTGVASQYCAAGASLMLVMHADADGDTGTTGDVQEVFAQPVGWYDIKGAQLADGENCDKHAGTVAKP